MVTPSKEELLALLKLLWKATKPIAKRAKISTIYLYRVFMLLWLARDVIPLVGLVKHEEEKLIYLREFKQ